MKEGCVAWGDIMNRRGGASVIDIVMYSERVLPILPLQHNYKL